MLRYSLTTLLLLIVAVALGCAALLYVSPLVKQITVTAAVLLLGLAVLIALIGRGRRRAAAVGFAFAGWAYLLLANTGAVNLQEHLLTRNVNRWLYDTLHPLPKAVNAKVTVRTDGQQSAWLDLDMAGDTDDLFMVRDLAAQGNSDQAVYRMRVQPAVPWRMFETVSHALWALLLGLLGAVAGAVIDARGRKHAAAGPSA